MEITKILSLAKHCLHLCNNSNIQEIVFSYLIESESDAFVTNNIDVWKKRFMENELKYHIKKPNDVTPEERIVVHGSSLHNDFIKWEERWKHQKKAICIYNIDEIEPSILKPLVEGHDKMLLSIDKLRMYSDKELEKEIEELSPEIVETLVKRELRSIVLSLLLSKPMSGTDLVKLLYQKFKVFISPGMMYPTLYEMEKSGLLKYDYKLKNKVYSIQEKDTARLMLSKHVKANSMLTEFLTQD